MSTATDIAELEAIVAENELGDDEAEALKEAAQAGAPLEEALAFILSQRESGDGDPPPEDGPPEELGEPSQKQLRDLEKETDRHLGRVRAIMGGHVAGFTDCRECGGIGLTPPGPKPQTHENYKACVTCSGFGEVLTGSLAQGHQSTACPDCRGRGYLERLDRAQGQPPIPAPVAPAPIVAAEYVAGGEAPAYQPEGAAASEWGVPAWMGDPAVRPPV